MHRFVGELQATNPYKLSHKTYQTQQCTNFLTPFHSDFFPQRSYESLVFLRSKEPTAPTTTTPFFSPVGCPQTIHPQVCIHSSFIQSNIHFHSIPLAPSLTTPWLCPSPLPLTVYTVPILYVVIPLSVIVPCHCSAACFYPSYLYVLLFHPVCYLSPCL